MDFLDMDWEAPDFDWVKKHRRENPEVFACDPDESCGVLTDVDPGDETEAA